MKLAREFVINSLAFFVQKKRLYDRNSIIKPLSFTVHQSIDDLLADVSVWSLTDVSVWSVAVALSTFVAVQSLNYGCSLNLLWLFNHIAVFVDCLHRTSRPPNRSIVIVLIRHRTEVIRIAGKLARRVVHSFLENNVRSRDER